MVEDVEKTIAPRILYRERLATVLNGRMAYVDTGSGEPIVFLHGNVTSSYMWRNIIPYVEGMARCIAVDNIGQGDLEKLPNSSAGSYRLFEHQRYVGDLLDQLALGGDVTLILHDWAGPSASPGPGGIENASRLLSRPVETTVRGCTTYTKIASHESVRRLPIRIAA